MIASAQTAPEAPAATDDTSQLQTIVVTAQFQKSLENALDAKRNDDRMTDGISSEDIGNFPAENIAEAIQRIPGVQISSINGRGSTISIRGLGPQYAVTTIDGQLIRSADFTDGFRYDIIPPEVASAIQVIKSPSADMDAGGLSGTVNIDTAKPLDYKQTKLIFSGKEQYAEFQGGKPTPKGTLTYADQFQVGDGMLGVLLSGGYQKLKDRADYLWIDKWYTEDTDEGTLYYPRRPRFRSIQQDTARRTLNGTVQWEPNDQLEMSLTGLYSQDITHNDMNQLVWSFDQDNETITQTDGLTGTEVSASDYTLENNHQLERHNWRTGLLTYNLKWKGDAWTLNGAASYTKGSTNEDERAVILGRSPGTTVFNDSDPSNISLVADADLTDTSAWDKSNLTRDEYPNGAITKVSDSQWSTQGDAERMLDFGPLTTVKFGAKYSKETLNRDVWRRDFQYLTNSGQVSGYDMFPELSDAYVTLHNFLDGGMASQSSWVSPDVNAYADALAASGITVPVLFAPQASYDIDKDIYAGYGMAKIDTAIGSMPLRGDFGVRYEHTKRTTDTYLTEADEYSEDANDIVGTDSSTFSYDNWLPSINLVLDIRDDLLLRMSAAKVLVRPILTSKTAIATTQESTVGTDGLTDVTVTLGQTDLKALTANQGDLSLEWYYGQGGGLTINGFLKNIKNGTYSELVCPDSYNGVTLSTNSDGDCQGSDGAIYDVTATYNDPTTVKIKGYEYGWTQSFDAFLPVKGFGLTANYTRVIPERDTDFTITNLSEKTWNFTGFWENDMYSARVSMNHRSSYEQDSADSFFATQGHVMRARTQTDAVLGYSPTERLSFQLGGLNLTNKKEEAYKDISSRWQMTGVTGRSYYLSMKWDLL